MTVGLLCGLGLVGTPAGASAQWTESRGSGWTSVTMYHQSTSEFFNSGGETTPYLLDGKATSTSLFVTTDIGLGRGFDAWVQLSFQRVEFGDLTAVRRSSGFGDLRLYARWSPSPAMGWSLPVAVRMGVKVPVGDFDAFSSVLPLGDGQTDLEVVGEIGHSFYPVDAYVTAWLGYRWRRPQGSTDFDFGDERFVLVTGGWTAERLGAKLGLEGWLGSEPTQQGLGTNGQARRMLRILPSLTTRLGPGSLEIGTRVPISGRNLPAGADFSVGYFLRWGGA